MNKVNFHGELCVVQVEVVSGEQVKPEGDFKLADSETTGNDHMLRVVPGVHVFIDSSDELEKHFVQAEQTTQIYCKLDNRHTALELPAGTTWKITPAQEWDHLARERRNVLD